MRPGPMRAGMGGFTLLELIIAMTLSALVAVIGATALSAGTDFYERARKRLKDHEDMRAAQRVLRIEWEARAPRVMDAEADWVEFETRQQVFTNPVPGGQRVRYRCVPEAKGYTLLHELLPYVAPAPAAQGGSAPTPPKRGVLRPIQQEVLVDGLLRCDFSFLPFGQGAAKNKTEARWVQYWDGQIPPATVMRVRLAAYRGELPPFVFVVMQ